MKAQVWWLLLLCLVALGVITAWRSAGQRIIPQCAEGIDHRIVAQVLAAAPKTASADAKATKVVGGSSMFVWSLDLNVLTSPQLPDRSQQASDENCQLQPGQRLLVRWQRTEAVVVGSQLEVTVRLRRPWGASNPHGFDFERWLIASGYAATGYVRSGRVREAPGVTPVRAQWISAVNALLAAEGLVHHGTLMALVTGDGGAVPAQTWERYRRTGAIHLLVVSGLHVSVLAVLLYALISYPLRLVTIAQHRAFAPLVGAGLVCLCAIALAWFTGLGSPVMRVALMLIGLWLLQLLPRRASIWRIWLLAALVSALLMPLQTFHSGFWLSYGAVAVLIAFFAPRSPASGSVASVIQAQGALWLGLTPLVILLLAESSLLVVPANLLTVPIMTLVTVPTLFVGLGIGFMQSIFPEAEGLGWLCTVALRVADFSLALIDVLLNALLNTLPQRSSSIGYVSVATAVVALLGGLMLLLPLSLYFRAGAICAWLPLLMGVQSNVPPGEFCVRVVDVGQGSAAVVDTASYRLLVDTGPRFANRDVGRSNVLPVLRSTGPHRLNLLLLSHTDIDHAGGLSFFRAYFDVLPEIGPRDCTHGMSWQQDGVRFTTLQAKGLTSDNDLSCTLLLASDEQTAYLSGDISARAERRLLEDLPEHISLLLAPHHGSKTSSSMPFVRHLSPDIVVFSAGRANRYGHPHKHVVRRFTWEQSRQFNTATSGTIQWCSHRPDRVRQNRF